MYNVSCNLCHVAYPKLNRFGNLFAENGYYFQGKQEEVNIEVSDENLKLFKQPPLAFRLVQNLVAQYSKDDKKVFPDFQSPFFAKLFTPFHHHRAISDSGPDVFEGDKANGCGLLYLQTKSLSSNLP